MYATARLAAHQLRTRWRGWLALALLVAVTGGTVLAAVAGARRTESAYPRFLAWSGASDVLVSPGGTGLTGFYAALARLPQVADLAPVVGLDVAPRLPDGRYDPGTLMVAPVDSVFGRVVDRPRLLAGRMPGASRQDEVVIDQNGADALHVHVGSTLPAQALPNSGHRVLRLRLEVVGIVVTRTSVDPVTDSDQAIYLQASNALWHRLGRQYEGFDGAEIRLRHGRSAAAFRRQAQVLARRFPATGGQVFVADQNSQVATVERSIRPESVALVLFALVLAVTALLIVGQAASRALASGSLDNRSLSALGMTRRQLMAAALAEVAAAGVAGAALACCLAVAVSGLMPIGTARLAEPDPGVSIDAPVLAIGGPALVLLLLARACWPAWRLAAVRARAGEEESARRSGIAAWLASIGAPVTAAIGVRLALEPGRGRTAVPVRGALAGTMLSVLAIAGAFTFGASLTHLVNAPRLYGQAWDAAIDLQFQGLTAAQARHMLRHDPGITGWSFGQHGIVTIGHTIVPAIGLATGRGPLLSPTLLQGRAPRSDREIALGSTTLRQIGRRVGQFVEVTISGHRRRDLIVGTAVFPNFGQGSFTPTDLGQGAETTAAVLQPQVRALGGGAGFQFVLLRFAAGPSRLRDIAAFQRSLAGFCATVEQSTCVVTNQHPNGITNYARIDGTPELLAAVLAGLGLAVLAQLIVVSGRRRRHDFAVLKALGLQRRQVRLIIAWQVSTLALVALAVGLPLGVAAGRRAWVIFASALGVQAHASAPAVFAVVFVPAALVLVNAVAFWPGRRTSRVRPAQALHAE